MSAQATLQNALEILVMLNCKYGRTLGEICEQFTISRRTAYRYIETLRNVGFVIDKKQSEGKNFYFINKEESHYRDISELLHFSREEAYILSRAIHSIDPENEIKNELIRKLYSLYDSERVAVPLIKKQNSHIVNQLSEAIRNKKQVKLKSYQSAHSNNIRDRLVEPIRFTTNYVSIWAFDVADQQNKIFKTSRIGDSDVTEKSWQFEKMHQTGFVDVFRISSYKKIPVKLELTLMAKNLLVEEYPLAERCITENDENRYLFETEVASLAGVGRFVLGLIDQINIIQPESLKEYLREKIEKGW
jgi:predicted DNA-binding transcriptional regulator YafY